MRTVSLLLGALTALVLALAAPAFAATQSATACDAPYTGCLAACGNCVSGIGIYGVRNCPYTGDVSTACLQACKNTYAACKAPYGRTPVGHSYEANTDRKGGDYFSTTMGQTQTPADCRALCSAEGNCRAWTFVKAGIQHPTNPRCWLKNVIAPAVASGCCTSGVKNPK